MITLKERKFFNDTGAEVHIRYYDSQRKNAQLPLQILDSLFQAYLDGDGEK